MDTLGKVSGGDLRKAITTLQSAVRLKARPPVFQLRPLERKHAAEPCRSTEPRELSGQPHLMRWYTAVIWASDTSGTAQSCQGFPRPDVPGCAPGMAALLAWPGC